MIAGEIFLLPYTSFVEVESLKFSVCLICFMKSLATVFHPAFKLQCVVFIKALNNLSFVPSIYPIPSEFNICI